MGENEQGGMLRVVVVIGIIAMVAAVVIFAITGLKSNATNHRVTAVQSMTKGLSEKDIDFHLTMKDGKIVKFVSKTDLIGEMYFADTLSGGDRNREVSYLTRPWEPGVRNAGVRIEPRLNRSVITGLNESSPSDYLELSIDYKIKNGRTVTAKQAQSLGLDTYNEWQPSEIRLGLRSSEHDFSKYATLDPHGDKEGTLTMTAPKSSWGETYEAYVFIWNVDFDSLQLDNLRISNATH